MRDQRGLDLHGPETVARDIEHVVDAAHDPEIAVLVAMCRIAGHVEAILKSLPVGLEITLVVTPDGAQHEGPGFADYQVSTTVLHFVATRIDDGGIDTGQRLRAGSRLGLGGAGQWRNQDAAGLGLPPGVDDGAAAAPDVLVVPHPGLGVDGLTHRA